MPYTWTSIFQISGSVWVGPGVCESVASVGVDVGCSVVTTAVGVGVAGGVVVCVHPAARMNTVQRTSADAITMVFFIPDNFPGVYFMFLFVPFEMSLLVRS